MSSLRFMGVNQALTGTRSGAGRFRWLWFGWGLGGSSYRFVGRAGLRLGSTFLERGPGHAIRMRDHAPTRTVR